MAAKSHEQEATSELVRKGKGRACRVSDTSVMTGFDSADRTLQTTPVAQVGRLRQGGCVFEVSLGYAERSCLKNIYK